MASDANNTVQQLLQDHTAGSDTDPAAVKRIDTHGATIYLIGDRAWKLKRAVRFPYFDFSTVELRQHTLESELRLNRRTAPNLYLNLHVITRDSDGHLALNGHGETVDWVLEMRRFPDDALFSQLADQDKLSLDFLKDLTDSIVEFHETADIFTDVDGYERFAAVTRGNIESLAAHRDLLGPEAIARVTLALQRATDDAKPLLHSRAQTGRVRHVHGDLHLANIALIDGKPTPFDCLEFNDEFAIIDTLYDLAFLIMDLWQRGMQHAANEVFNRYLDRSAIDETGVALMPLFLSTRAVIRAHVSAAQARGGSHEVNVLDRAKSYLQLAEQLLQADPPRLIAIGGLSGSGKSTVARRIAADIGRAPGARLLRSDVLRKRAAGELPETRLPSTAYTPEQNLQTYRDLAAAAATTLANGQAVIADAVFHRPHEREQIMQIASDLALPFDGVWLQCDEATRVARVAARRDDASDADTTIARAQSAYSLPNLDESSTKWHTLDASAGHDEVIRQVREMLLKTAQRRRDS